jgi:hypothetical protein
VPHRFRPGHRCVHRVQAQRRALTARRGHSDVWEPADVDRSGDDDVADEDEPECWLSGITLFGQVVEVTLGHFGQFLVRVNTEWGELVLGWSGRDILARSAVQPVGAVVVDDCAQPGDTFRRDPHDSAFQQSGGGDTQASSCIDQLGRVEGREVDGVSPWRTQVRDMPVQHGLATVPLGPLALIQVGVGGTQTIERKQMCAPEVLPAQVVDESHSRIVSSA